MAARLPRRKIALTAVDRILQGESVADVMKMIAAYLVTTRRVREYELVAYDMEDIFAERGHSVVDVASAFPLTRENRDQIAKMVGKSDVQFRETLDPSLLGGIYVGLPGKRFDGTLRHKLTTLGLKKV